MTASTRSCRPIEVWRTRRRLRRAGTLIVLGLLACAAPAQEFKPPFDLKAAAVVADGQQLFNRSCAGRCHGVDGMEGFDAPILVGKAYLEAPFVYVMLIVGKPGTAMPSWKGRLPDDDLWKIIAYVSSLGERAKRAGSN
jgi:mono/diheme cytochrome c family protein